jgi:hypothetical protein
MPLDTSILTNQPSVFDQVAKLSQLRNMQLQQQLGQQQLQAGAIENQQKQRALDAQTALNDSMRSHVTTGPDGRPVFDIPGISRSLIDSGHGDQVPAITEHLQKIDETAAGITEKQAQAAKANQEVKTAQSDYQGLVGVGIKDMGYQPGAAIAGIAHAVAQKQLDPQSAQDLTAKIQANPTPQFVQSLVDPMIQQSAAAQKLLNERTTAAASTTRANAAQTDANINQQKLPGQLQTQQLTNTELTQKTTGAVPLTAKDQLEAKMQAQRNSIAQQNANSNAQRTKTEMDRYGFEANGGVSPAGKSIASLDLDPGTVRSMVRNNPGLISQAKTVDPNFSMTDLDKRYETLKEFTSSSNSKAGGQVLALNTMIHHADLYQQVAAALKNGSWRPGNAAYNAVAQAFGAAPPANAALVGQFLAGETAKLAQGGAPFESEVKDITKVLGTNSSPEQIANAGKTLLQVASGRAIPLQEKVDDARLNGKVQVIGPDAQAILQRNGYDPKTLKPTQTAAAGSVRVKAADGRTGTFKGTAADAAKAGYTVIQ